MFGDLQHAALMRASFSGLYSGRFLTGQYHLQGPGLEWVSSSMRDLKPDEFALIKDKTVLDDLGKARVAQRMIQDEVDNGFHLAQPVAAADRVSVPSR
mmetsp:Transcript_25403/g.37315  ORF Transcript_25403/g.37315 Transcript_25403/m.37315 type:complete len:98 (+) Transcript_25403:72-365(+)